MAIGVDGDNRFVPVAFAFVESDNKTSWLWSLKLVKRVVVGQRGNVCVLHDRHADLLYDVDTLQKGEDAYVHWPDLYSRWCMRYLCANFHRQFKSK